LKRGLHRSPSHPYSNSIYPVTYYRKSVLSSPAAGLPGFSLPSTTLSLASRRAARGARFPPRLGEYTASSG
jgi:hypothetical protein